MLRPLALALALTLGGLAPNGHSVAHAMGENAAAKQRLAEQEARNRALEERIALLRAALDGDVCADPAAARALLRTTARMPAPAGAIPQAQPAALTTPASAKALPRGAMVPLLEQATVLVLAPPNTGSGFFVAPDTVLTNRHVIATAKNGEVVLVGKGIARPLLARVMASTPDSNAETGDFAVLKVIGGTGGAVLPLSASVTTLDEVVAAGYPGLLLSTDKSFEALLKGDAAAIPNLAMSRGEVMAVQNRGQGMTTIAHTAQISSGNSGGPLVDRCGRVVGINTFLTINAKESSKAAFALSGSDLAAFARAHGVGLNASTAKCAD